MSDPIEPAELSKNFETRSTSGQSLSVWVRGEGTPIVLVHGSFADHSAWDIPVSELNRHFTSYAMDRRGFGASPDSAVYSIDLEFEDVAAVVDAVHEQTGREVVLWGHSYGANCAMGGANMTDHVTHLILYEPSFGLEYPEGVIEDAEDALARGDTEEAVVIMLFDILGMNESEIGAIRNSDRWPQFLEGAHTTPRECRVEEAWEYRPGQFDDIEAPTLILSGSDSTPSLKEAAEAAAGAIPGAVIRVLDGHGHFAHRTDPEMVVSMIRNFVET